MMKMNLIVIVLHIYIYVLCLCVFANSMACKNRCCHSAAGGGADVELPANTGIAILLDSCSQSSDRCRNA